ncbi:MAG: YggS family pyridoxal phosphate enzyme, partial [Spirochaetes bacterium GWC1_27_15]
IQSIDKIDTLDVIEKKCSEKNKKMDFLIEVNTSFEMQKYGVLVEDFDKLLEQITKKDYKFCNLRGIMTVGPLTDDKVIIKKSFKLLNDIFIKIRQQIKKTDFDIISMGMSSDFEIAISEGSNLVRIGSAIFGKR